MTDTKRSLRCSYIDCQEQPKYWVSRFEFKYLSCGRHLETWVQECASLCGSSSAHVVVLK